MPSGADRYHGKVTLAAVNWDEFAKYLSKSVRNPRQVQHRIATAKQIAKVLETMDASPLLDLSLHKRLYTMKTLSRLSKFLGLYAEWQQLREDYGLSWKEDDDVATFKKITEGANIDTMIEWVQKASRIAPEYKGVLRYACLTGLRLAEVFESLRLPNEGYHNTKEGTLEHYRHADIFIRPKKKAYLSIMTDETMKIRKNYKAQLSYNALRLTLRRHGIPMNMQYCRKIYGTYLKKQGIDNETIDLLQGRLPKGVFLRFYNRPNFKQELDKVRACLGKLALSIDV